MKKLNTKHIVIIGIVVLILSAIILWFVMDKDKEEPNVPAGNQAEDVQDDQDEDVKEESKEEAEEEAAPPTVVSQEQETVKGKISDFKYGVKKQPVTYNTYDVYSDGTKKLVKSEDDILYFHDGYQATMEELQVEGDANVVTYIEDYQEILRLVNEVRAAAGVQPLTLDVPLCRVASFRAVELEYSGVFSHKRPDGTGCFEVTQFYEMTYEYLAENIAQGYKTPEKAVKAWKENRTDYDYMVSDKFTKLGVGFSNVGINPEWVLVFMD